MKNSLKRLMPLLFLAMLTYSGCAKQQVVRNDDSLAPSLSKQADSTATKPAVTAASAPEKSPLITGNAAPTPVMEQNIAAKGSQATTTAAEVQRQLETIYFDFDSSALSGSARQALTNNAAVITRNPLVKVRVEGHCDERGSDEYNLAVGERRDKAAVHYLEALGVAAGRLSSLSFGKEKPADPGHDEAAWAKNRRVEFVITR